MAMRSSVDCRIGVVGGGQLGRMMAEAAAPLGVELGVLDPTPDAPATPLARNHIVAPFDDVEGLHELAEASDVLTYEIELADPDVLERVSAETETPVQPSPDTLRTIQDKLVQKRTLAEAGIPVPEMAPVDNPDDLVDACEAFGYPAMLKARSGGYDGRGNVPVEHPDVAADALAGVHGPAMVESFVDFAREISVIGAKGVDDRRCYVPAENIHEAEILRESVVPARISADVRERALEVAHEVLDVVTGRGVYGIELFETRGGEILVNEIAPRPHNSGHWTIEGAVTSQFEQHVRAVLGLPLGATDVRSPIVTANLLGDTDAPTVVPPSGIEGILAAGDARLHWYGKDEVRPLRKMGHVTVHDPSERDTDILLETARTYAGNVTFRSNEV